MATSSRKAICATLVGNCLIAIIKSIAAFMTGSPAMLSETIHSFVRPPYLTLMPDVTEGLGGFLCKPPLHLSYTL